MKEQNERFPSALEAVFVVIALYAVEYLIAAAFRDARGFAGLDPRDLDGVVTLAGNGILFIALMHYKRMSYGSLFHPSSNSVRATVATLSLPILFLIPALLLAMWAVLSLLVWLIPMSRWEEAMFDRMMSSGIASIVTVCILAPVLEEMLFRGIILRSFLKQYSKWAAILGSAALFGLAHLNIYQFAVGLIVGTILGWIYERARSLWPCMLLHGAYNSTLTALFFVGGSVSEQDAFQLSTVFWVTSFLLAFAGATLLRHMLASGRKR